MATENVTTRFRVDISDLRSNINAANRQIQLLTAEMRNANAGMEHGAETADSLSTKIQKQQQIVEQEERKLAALREQLQRLNENQQQGEQIVADLTAQYNNAVETYGEASAEARQYAAQLSQAQNAQNRNREAIERLNVQIVNQDTAVQNARAQVTRYQTALDTMQSETQQTASTTETLTDRVSRQESELRELRQRYIDVAAEQGDTSAEAQQLAQQINDLSGELRDNRARLNDAEQAADQLDQSLDNAGESAEDAANGGFTVFKGVLSNIITNVIDGLIRKITDLTSEAIDAADSMAKFEQTMGFAGYDSATIEQASADVKEYADRTVYELDTIANTTAQLAANGVTDFTGLTQAMGNLNAVAGGSADTFNSAAMVLTQTAGAGKLTTENWNQLANAIPGASGVLIQALKDAGAYTGDFREAMANGEITAEEFNAAILKLGNEPVAVEAATSVTTFEGAIGNLQATAVSGLMEIYDTIGRENVTNVINKISALVAKVMPVIQKGVKWLIKNLPTVTAVITGVATAVGTFMLIINKQAIITAFTTGLTAIKTAFMGLWTVLSANPVALVVAAIAGLVAAFILLWNKSEAFRNFWIGIWENIKEVSAPIFEAIKQFFVDLWETAQPLIEFLRVKITAAIAEVQEMFTAAWAAITAIWDFAQPYFAAIWEAIQIIFSVVSAWFKSVFGTAWENIKKIWNAVKPYFKKIWDGIRLIFSAAKTVISGFFTAAWNSIKVVWDLAVGYFKMIWENIKLVFSVVEKVFRGDFQGAWNAIKQIWDNVVSYFQSVWDGIKTVFASVTEFFKTTFGAGVTAIQGVWSVVVGFFGGIWASIKTTFSSVGTWFKDKFKTAWDNIKSVFNLETVKNFFGGLWDGIKDQFTSIGTSVGEAVGGAFKTAINWAIDKIEETLNFLPDNINGALQSITDLTGIEVPLFPTVDLPRLAKGGIINRSMLANIGEDGAEAVIPLERNKAGLRQIANLLADEMGGVAQGGTPKGDTIYNFTQTNNSPKALSRWDIYRQTRNLINATKGV